MLRLFTAPKCDIFHHLASRVELCFLNIWPKDKISHCPLLPHNETRLEQHQAVFFFFVLVVFHLFPQRRAEVGVGGSSCTSQLTWVTEICKKDDNLKGDLGWIVFLFKQLTNSKLIVNHSDAHYFWWGMIKA